jgi:hypothetical protein
MSFSQGSRTTVTEHDLSCTVKFDDDLPNGPFVEGSAGNMMQAGSMSVSVPPNDATWGQVAELAAAHHQKELDAFCKGGEMRNRGGGNRVGNVATCTAVGVTYKGGKVPDDGQAREGSCTVRLSTTNTRSQEVQCCTIL